MLRWRLVYYFCHSLQSYQKFETGMKIPQDRYKQEVPISEPLTSLQ